jgi:hypothetical protein
VGVAPEVSRYVATNPKDWSYYKVWETDRLTYFTQLVHTCTPFKFKIQNPDPTRRERSPPGTGTYIRMYDQYGEPRQRRRISMSRRAVIPGSPWTFYSHCNPKTPAHENEIVYVFWSKHI